LHLLFKSVLCMTALNEIYPLLVNHSLECPKFANDEEGPWI
jgi:hypothetical protein